MYDNHLNFKYIPITTYFVIIVRELFYYQLVLNFNHI